MGKYPKFYLPVICPSLVLHRLIHIDFGRCFREHKRFVLNTAPLPIYTYYTPRRAEIITHNRYVSHLQLLSYYNLPLYCNSTHTAQISRDLLILTYIT